MVQQEGLDTKNNNFYWILGFHDLVWTYVKKVLDKWEAKEIKGQKKVEKKKITWNKVGHRKANG